MNESLEHAISEWSPGRVTVTRAIDSTPLARFADLLDDPADFAVGAPVPLLWHWLAFTESCPQNSLGDDGHPADGHFLPPFEDRRRMMAGGRLAQRAPFLVGKSYTRSSELATAELKDGRSGRMLFTTLRHTFTDEAGSTIASEDEDVVYRQQRAGQTRRLSDVIPATPAAPWHEPFGHDGTRRFSSDPRVLFRFSALTYNTHRIHYDHPYVTAVEGYPGLVVHGPLLALQMAELLRRADIAPAHFAYRLSAPTYSGAPTIATRDDRFLRVGACDGATVSATATFEL